MIYIVAEMRNCPLKHAQCGKIMLPQKIFSDSEKKKKKARGKRKLEAAGEKYRAHFTN